MDMEQINKISKAMCLNKTDFFISVYRNTTTNQLNYFQK